MRLITGCAGIEEALLRQSQLLALENPSSRVRKAVMGWFAHTDPLVGVGRDIFADTMDLVALRTAPDQDRLSLFLQDHSGYLFRVGLLLSSTLQYPSCPVFSPESSCGGSLTAV